MAEYRKNRDDAIKANAKLDSAITKLNGILSVGKSNYKDLSNRDDFLSEGFKPLISEVETSVPKIITTLNNLKSSITERAEKLDREENDRLRRERERAKKNNKLSDDSTSNVVSLLE